MYTVKNVKRQKYFPLVLYVETKFNTIISKDKQEEQQKINSNCRRNATKNIVTFI